MVKTEKRSRIVRSFTYRECEEIIRKLPRTKTLGSGTGRGVQKVTEAIIGMEKGIRMDRFMQNLDDPAYCDRCLAESQQGTASGPIKMVLDHMQTTYPKTYEIYLSRVGRPRQQTISESMV